MFHRLFDDPGRFLLPGLVVGVVTLSLLSYRQRIGDARTARVGAVAILVLWLGFVVFADLIGPTNLAPGLPRPSFNLIPFHTLLSDEFPGRESQELVGNVALFIPLGAFLPFVSTRLASWWHVGLVALVLSFALEGAQFLANAGRLSDIDDTILNTTGAVVGWLAWRSLASFRAGA